MRQLLLAAGLLAATASLAGATGGYYCTIEDENLTLVSGGEMSIGMGGEILSHQASADIKTKAVPEALRKLDLSNRLVHHWFYHPEVRLHFYAETPPDADTFASLEMILLTEATDEPGVYEGDYLLSVFNEAGEVIDLTGKVTCDME